MEDNIKDKDHFNHDSAALVDRLSLVGELCHLRRHLLRSAVSLRDTDEELFYLVMANRCKTIRREYMRKHFADVPEELWCAVKTACCIRQLSYEVWDGKDEMLGDIDALCDEIFTKALGEDMQGCAVCREDKGAKD